MKFWGDDEHPKETLCPKNYGLKLSTTPGIANLMPLPQEHEELENHQIEGFPTGFEGQDHQEKRHNNLMCDSQNKSRKENLQILLTRIPRKGSENHRKRQTGETQSSLEEPRRIIYT
jgi:hypothetical protein